MIPQTTLKELLDYNPATGALSWKTRDRKYFVTDRAFNTFNSRYANKPAFTAIGKHGYQVGAIFNHNYRAHRVIWWLEYGYDPDQIDHINGNKTDNRLENLRDVCGQENQQNMKRAVNNASGHTGVGWDKSKNKWVAYINVNKKRKHLGRFHDLDDAVAARKQAEKDHDYHPNHGR